SLFVRMWATAEPTYRLAVVICAPLRRQWKPPCATPSICPMVCRKPNRRPALLCTSRLALARRFFSQFLRHAKELVLTRRGEHGQHSLNHSRQQRNVALCRGDDQPNDAERGVRQPHLARCVEQGFAVNLQAAFEDLDDSHLHTRPPHGDGPERQYNIIPRHSNRPPLVLSYSSTISRIAVQTTRQPFIASRDQQSGN